MNTKTNLTVLVALVCGLLSAGTAAAQGAGEAQGVTGPKTPDATISQKPKSKPFASAELGFQGTVMGDGVFFMGPVITLQGGHFRPIAGVFHIGLGAALYSDPIPDPMLPATDPAAKSTKNAASLYVGLGVRLRIFQLIKALAQKRFDLFVGPLAMVFANHDLVTFGVAGELGFAVHLGRFRLALTAHGGYQSVLHQYAVAELYKFNASYLVGGQLSAGVSF